MHDQATPAELDTTPSPSAEPFAAVKQHFAKAPLFLTVRESAALLRVDDVTVTRAIADGEFPALKIRRRYVVPAAVFDRIIKDILMSGRCIDIADWTRAWAAETGAPLPAWTR